MQSTVTVWGVVFCTSLIAAGNAFPAPHYSCAGLEGKTVEQYVNYLAQPRASSKFNCVAYAMDRIGLRKYAAAIEVLIQYLDYNIDDQIGKTGGNQIGAYDPYPAVVSLSEIGRPAITRLVEKLAEGDTSDVVRQSAVRALLYICRDSIERVNILVKASREASDNAKAENLIRAARMASDGCPDQVRTECINALSR